ncbi:MAG: hypothetical protein IPP18_00670, partial [Rhodocyclaceae bacterium]|nr:hypothetical protein [Rhodocyclaceae bacterium]
MAPIARLLPASMPVAKQRADTFTVRATQLFLHQTLQLSLYAAHNAGNRDR